MKNTLRVFLLLVFVQASSFVASDAHATTVAKVKETVATFKRKDPGIKRFFKDSYAYAVFPTVGKAGIGIGGAYGTGRVYQHGKFTGSAKLSQLSIGLQWGGQAYSEVIFFQNKASYSRFVDGKLKIGAQISAVAVNQGAAANASFNQGIAIFTATKGGLMYEAAISGQVFEFTPAK
jgi:lipid-binding SYLF domain-containing protein